MADPVRMPDSEANRNTAGGKPGSKTPARALLCAAVAVVLSTGGYLGYGMLDGKVKRERDAKDTERANPVQPGIVQLSPFVVNLNDAGASRYLKCSIVLQTSDEEVARMLEADPFLRPRIKDTVLLALSSKTSQEVQSLNGKLNLRKELTARINGLLDRGEVTSLFFTEFVLQ